MDIPVLPRVGINGLLAFALNFEKSQVTLIKLIKSIRFSFVHGIPPFFKCPELGNDGSYTLI